MTDSKPAVWILGAGFSRSLGMPLLPSLLSGASTHRALTTYGAELDRGLTLLVSQFFEAGAWGRPHQNPIERQWEHAEEFLERLDLASTDGGATERTHLEEFAHRWSKAELRTKYIAEKIGRSLSIKQMRDHALKMVAAEVCAPLEYADVRHERWMPYVRWAERLNVNDTILTFNYDRVLDLLAEETRKLWIPDPATLSREEIPPMKATVLKLHGSVDWEVGHDGVLQCASGSGAYKAALSAKDGQSPLASPGPTKRLRTTEQGPLVPLWREAETTLRQAHGVCFLGYRIPPTDARSREFLLEGLKRTEPSGSQPYLAIHTVLGPDTQHADSRRLMGLLKRDNNSVTAVPMGAEDFLAMFERRDVFQLGKL